MSNADRHSTSIRFRWASLLLVFGIAVSCAPQPSMNAFFKRGTKAYYQADYVSAFKDFRYAAENNHPEGQYFLAKMYGNGEGVTQDLNQASFWHFKAAEAGVEEAQHTLGLMYQYGSGVVQDATEAKFWLGKAAEGGYAPAQLGLAELLAQSGASIEDVIGAYTWFSILMIRESGDLRSKALEGRGKISRFLDAEKRIGAEQTARAWTPYN